MSETQEQYLARLEALSQAEAEVRQAKIDELRGRYDELAKELKHVSRYVRDPERQIDDLEADLRDAEECEKEIRREFDPVASELQELMKQMGNVVSPGQLSLLEVAA